MILISHALVGTALTGKHFQGGMIFAIAFASHYILDAIPHWHYSVPQIQKVMNDTTGRETLSFQMIFFPDFLKIAVDCIVGGVLSYFIFGGSMENILLAVMGAVAPDVLVGLSRFYPQYVLELHYRFHSWAHSNMRLDDQPFLGIVTQVIFVIVMVIVSKKIL